MTNGMLRVTASELAEALCPYSLITMETTFGYHMDGRKIGIECRGLTSERHNAEQN